MTAKSPSFFSGAPVLRPRRYNRTRLETSDCEGILLDSTRIPGNASLALEELKMTYEWMKADTTNATY